MTYRLKVSAAARSDVTRILRTSGGQFGRQARERYEALIATALRDLREDPFRIEAQPRAELAEGLRTYHLNHCRERAALNGRRVAMPRHLVAFRVEDQVVVVLRVLHDAMELSHHLAPFDKDVEQ